jgi:hypothetical protein
MWTSVEVRAGDMPDVDRQEPGARVDDAERDTAVARVGEAGFRWAFLFGCPRSRTTVGQRVFSQGLNLVTMASTNWFLEHASMQVLNGPAGSSREQMCPFAIERVRDQVRVVTGRESSASFRLEEAWTSWRGRRGGGAAGRRGGGAAGRRGGGAAGEDTAAPAVHLGGRRGGGGIEVRA